VSEPNPATHQSVVQARLDRLRELAAQLSSYQRRFITDQLAQDPTSPGASCARYAALAAQCGPQVILIGDQPSQLAALIEEQARTKDWRPIALIDLDTGEQRQGEIKVVFIPAAIVMPACIATVIKEDLADRRQDPERARDAEREQELNAILARIDAGEPVPAEHYPLLVDVIEVNLETRRKDDQREQAEEHEIQQLQCRLLGA
jgi:hypothetical protein